MNQINVSWYNTLNPTERGYTTVELPASIGRDPENNVVLPQEATGVASQHGIVVQSGKKLILMDVRKKKDMGLGQRGFDIMPNKPFHVGFYRLTVNHAALSRGEN